MRPHLACRSTLSTENPMATKLAPGTFFGQTLGSLEVAGLTFAESVYTTRLAIPTHEHTNAFFYFVIEGRYEEVYGRKTRIGSPSTLAFHPAGEPHSNHWHSAGGRVFHIDISRARARSISEHGPILDSPAEFLGGVAPWLASRLYREYRRSQGASPLAMEGLALEILAELARNGANVPERTPPYWLLRARDVLHDRFAENLSFDEVAAEVSVHPVHLARVFRRHYGCTPGDYVRRLRVEFACRQLASSDMPLIGIALSAGFSDQSHFTKTFRQHMRMTPGEFRRHFRGR
jgi:AraC family transcriptional regulator